LQARTLEVAAAEVTPVPAEAAEAAESTSESADASATADSDDPVVALPGKGVSCTGWVHGHATAEVPDRVQTALVHRRPK
jgi:hypothetical protein